MSDDILISQSDLALWLGIAPRTLEQMRSRGDGPPYIAISRRCVRYRPEDVEKWLDERTRRKA